MMREINVKKNQSIEKAATILNCFSMDAQYLTADTITQLVHLPKATVYRMLYSLEVAGLVQYNAVDETYCLGIKMLEYGGIVLGRFYIRRIASPFLTALNHNTDFMVLLGIIENEHLVYIDKREGRKNMGQSARIGSIGPPHRGVLGKTIMAFYDEQKVDELLQRFPLVRYTDKSVVDPGQMKRKLQRFKTLGYGIDVGETTTGINGIAVPIKNKWNQVVASIAITGPSDLLQPDPDLINMVNQCANQISMELGATTLNEVQIDGSEGV